MWPPAGGYPPGSRVQEDRFLTASSTVGTIVGSTPPSFIWTKPRWAKMHDILLVSPGGGGGSGFTGIAGAGRGGGGAGSSGQGFLYTNVKSIFLPSALLIVVGKGGAGGTAGNGQPGAQSGILMPQTNYVTTQLGILEALAGGNGGIVGNGAAGGAGGAATSGGGFTFLRQITGNLSMTWASAAGAAGGLGGAGGSGATNGGPFHGGNGGGGCSGGSSSNGGNPINHPFPPALYPLGGKSAGANGDSAYFSFDDGLFIRATAGGGGAGNDGGKGGDGGASSPGAGGSGGGGGITAGVGSPGGDGYCIIWSW